MTKNVVSQLRNGGKVVRGWIGVYVQRVTPEIAESLNLDDDGGALVADITAGGPADKAGVKRGDIIVEVNGYKIDEMPELPKILASYAPGTKTKLKVIRNGEEKVLNLKLEELPDQVAQNSRQSPENEVEQNLGLIVQEITPEVKRKLDVEYSSGVVITDVRGNSLASEAGLLRGDVILEINKKQIATLDNYRKAVDSVKEGKNILFLVKRGSNTIYVALKAEAEDDRS
jgi:serine protease Do